MILNNPRAVNFICQCFQGKNWPIPYLAVWGIMVIPELIWGRCTYMIFIKFSQNVFMGISFEKCEKNWGSPCWLRSGRPKCKLPSKLRKIIKDTKRYGVKGMNLSAHSNILGNIVNALEMILNNPRAVNFICQCFQGKNWPIPYLAVCGLMVIPELIWARRTYMIFIKFSQNVYMGLSFEKMRKKLGVTMLVKEWQTQMQAAVTIEKIVKATKRYGVKGMNLSARSNILGNIINALAMILNHQRAILFI